MNRKLPKGRTNRARHEDRRSFEKFALPGQRTQTLTMDKLDERRAAAMFSDRMHINIGRNGHREPQAYSRAVLTPDFTPKARLVARGFGRSCYGPVVASKGRMYAGESVFGSHRDWQQKVARV